MAHDAFVFLVESIHGPPGKSDQTLQIACMGGQVGVLPCSPRRDVLLVDPNAVPGRRPKIGVLSDMLGSVPAHVGKHRPSGNRPRDNGPVRKAGAPVRYRRSSFPQSARGCGGVTVRRTRVAWAAARGRESGRLLPLKAGLVARTVPTDLSLQHTVSRWRTCSGPCLASPARSDGYISSAARPWLQVIPPILRCDDASRGDSTNRKAVIDRNGELEDGSARFVCGRP